MRQNYRLDDFEAALREMPVEEDAIDVGSWLKALAFCLTLWMGLGWVVWG